MESRAAWGHSWLVSFSNEAGRCKSFFSGELASLRHTRAVAFQEPRSCAPVFTRHAQFCVASSVWCCPPTISSVTTDHEDLCELPCRKGAGSLTNRTVTVRTIADFKHSRTDSSALLLSTTTELAVVNLIPQHDPQTNAQLAGHR